MMWRSLVIVAATVGMISPALAQQPSVVGGDLIQRLQGTNPADLAAQARSALETLNQMPPDQRRAAEAAAQAQIPALMGAATDWWNKMTPDQQAAYRQQMQGMDLLNKDK